MNSFKERFKSFSYADLLRIVENESEYKPEAIDAVKNELGQRQIAEADLNLVQKELESERVDRFRKIEKRIQTKARWKQRVISGLDLLNPIQKTAPSTERRIRLLTLFFGILSIYRWVVSYDIILVVFENDMGRYLTYLLYIVPLIVLPAITVLLALRKKWGWILAASNMILDILYSVLTLGILSQMDTSGMPEMIHPFFDNLIPQLVSILLSSGVFWVLCSKEVMHQFSIRQMETNITVGIVVIVVAFIIGITF